MPERKRAAGSSANPRAAKVRATTGMSDEAVLAKTGKTWSQWFGVLDRAGAQRMDHARMARWLHDERGLPGWWAQMLTVGYERARGLRKRHQRPDGYQVSRSRTITVPASRIFAAWNDVELRRRWLDADLHVHKATPHKSVRITWQADGTRVEVGIYPKDGGKSQVTVQHGKLPDARRAELMKAYWGERLERLKALLES